MWVKRIEYNRLQDCERMNTELKKEVVRLSDMLSSQVEDCKIGPWCQDCKHIGTDMAVVKKPVVDFSLADSMYATWTDGVVWYCKKHIHEFCPEFEM